MLQYFLNGPSNDMNIRIISLPPPVLSPTIFCSITLLFPISYNLPPLPPPLTPVRSAAREGEQVGRV